MAKKVACNKKRTVLRIVVPCGILFLLGGIPGAALGAAGGAIYNYAKCGKGK
jgi:hypothetical protein